MDRQRSLMWVKGTGNGWCKLFDLNLSLIRTHGVYVIWHGGYPSRVVRVGQGDIARELDACCRDARVISYLQDGALFVTWATVDASDAEGVALHLARTLRPLVEAPAAVSAFPIVANAPFALTWGLHG